MLFDEFVVGAHFVQLVDPVLVDQSAIVLELLLAVLQCHQLMLCLDVLVFLQFLLDFLDLLWKLALVHLGSGQYLLLPASEEFLLVWLYLAG